LSEDGNNGLSKTESFQIVIYLVVIIAPSTLYIPMIVYEIRIHIINYNVINIILFTAYKILLYYYAIAYYIYLNKLLGTI